MPSCAAIDDDLIDQIFDFMVRDLSKFALQLYSKPSSTEQQMAYCMRMVRKANVDEARYQRVLEKNVYAMNGVYEMDA